MRLLQTSRTCCFEIEHAHFVEEGPEFIKGIKSDTDKGSQANAISFAHRVREKGRESHIALAH